MGSNPACSRAGESEKVGSAYAGNRRNTRPPAGAGERCLDQTQEKPGLTGRMGTPKGEIPRAREGCGVGPLLCGNSTCRSQVPHTFFVDAFLHLLLNWICSSVTSACHLKQAASADRCQPACVPLWANLGTATPTPTPPPRTASIDATSELRGGFRPEQREIQASGRGETQRQVPRRMTADRFTHLSTRPVILTVLAVTNFSSYSADTCSGDKNPSGHLEELSAQSALPSLRENLPGFWHPFRLYLC